MYIIVLLIICYFFKVHKSQCIHVCMGLCMSSNFPCGRCSVNSFLQKVGCSLTASFTKKKPDPYEKKPVVLKVAVITHQSIINYSHLYGVGLHSSMLFSSQMNNNTMYVFRNLYTYQKLNAMQQKVSFFSCSDRNLA